MSHIDDCCDQRLQLATEVGEGVLDRRRGSGHDVA